MKPAAGKIPRVVMLAVTIAVLLFLCVGALCLGFKGETPLLAQVIIAVVCLSVFGVFVAAGWAGSRRKSAN